MAAHTDLLERPPVSDSDTTETVSPPPEAEVPAELELAGGFPAADRDQWRAEVGKVLSKRGPAPDDVEAALATRTRDGLTIAPLYTAQDTPGLPAAPGFAPFTRGRRASGTGGAWDLRVRQASPDADQAHAQVLEDLESGATSVWLVVGDAGVPIEGLPTALADVLLDLAGVVLDAGADYAAVAQAYLEHAAGRGVELSQLSGNLGADPLAVLARTGAQVDGAPAVALAQRAAAELPGVRALVVDALPWHEAGGSDVDELALSLAHGVHYLRLLGDAGLAPAEAAAQLEFRYAATADQFATIAKLRAARRLWARVLEACEAPAEARGQLQHAVTSWTMTTARDPWVTLLRDTLATFAAGVGGADSVTVLPFDSPIGQPEALSRRMARNTSSILVEESHVARVTDPAGGSYFVESLTDDLARKAWAVFQEVEGAGGVEAGLLDGSVATRLAASADLKQKALAKRKDAITGVTEFPFLDEKPLERTPAVARQGGGLPRLRWSEPYEALRDASDAHLASTGARPSALAVTWGPLKQHVARLDYVRNLLLPGGVAVEDADAGALPATVPSLVVLVAADGVEPAEVTPVVEALRKAGATHVLRAGKPKDPADWPGVDGFVHVGIDALALLRSVHDELGVKA
jgi:methylmalonyl-CoA mutase